MFNNLTIEETVNESDIVQVRQLRQAVWKAWAIVNPCDENILFNEINDELDNVSLHWVIRHNGEIIAAARLTELQSTQPITYLNEYLPYFDLPTQHPFYLYSRLTVHPDYRQQGLGTALDKVRLEYLHTTGFNWALAYCEEFRKEPLEQLGFTVAGRLSNDVFDTYPYHDNYLMVLRPAAIH